MEVATVLSKSQHVAKKGNWFATVFQYMKMLYVDVIIQKVICSFQKQRIHVIAYHQKKIAHVLSRKQESVSKLFSFTFFS